jgi:hypothetical protein
MVALNLLGTPLSIVGATNPEDAQVVAPLHDIQIRHLCGVVEFFSLQNVFWSDERVRRRG